MGTGVMALASQLAQGALPMKAMVMMVIACARPAVSEEGLGEALLGCGVAHVAEALSDLLCGVLGGVAQDGARDEMAALMRRFPDV